MVRTDGQGGVRQQTVLAVSGGDVEVAGGPLEGEPRRSATIAPGPHESDVNRTLSRGAEVGARVEYQSAERQPGIVVS